MHTIAKRKIPALKFVDYLCASIIFGTGVIAMITIEVRHPPHAVLDTPVLWIVVSMFNLLRLRNGYGVTNLGVFCIGANLATLVLEVVRLRMFGFVGFGSVVAVPVFAEVLFSLTKVSFKATNGPTLRSAADSEPQFNLSSSARVPRTAYLVYLLPVLHLGGCLAIWLTHNLGYMLIIDAPFSALFLGLAYKGVNPVISFGILGTLWWYLISLVIRWIVVGITTGLWNH
jgi:hypothetical protein